MQQLLGSLVSVLEHIRERDVKHPHLTFAVDYA